METSIKFTTKSMVSAGIPIKVKYEMKGDELIIRGKEEANKDLLITLTPADMLYSAARAAYEELQRKRAAAAAAPREVPEKIYKGMSLKGPGFEIYMDGSIDRATVTFKRKPSAEVREQVKAAGFYWSPVNRCWSRKLTNKAWAAAQDLYAKLR